MLYTLLLHGVDTPLLQEHVAGIMQQELQGNVYIYDRIFVVLECVLNTFHRGNVELRTKERSFHKCGLNTFHNGKLELCTSVTYIPSGIFIIQFGLVLFGSVRFWV